MTGTNVGIFLRIKNADKNKLNQFILAIKQNENVIDAYYTDDDDNDDILNFERELAKVRI